MAQRCGGNSTSFILCFIYMYLSLYFFPLGFCRQSVSSVSKVRVGQVISLLFKHSTSLFFHLFCFQSLEDVCGAVKLWFMPLPFNLRNSIRLPRSRPEMKPLVPTPPLSGHPLSKVWKTAGIFNVPLLYWDPNTFLLPCQINLWKHVGGKKL